MLETVGVPEGIQCNDEWSKEEEIKTGTKIKKKQDQVHSACRTQFVDLHSRNYRRTINDRKIPKSTMIYRGGRFVDLYSTNDQKVPVTFRNYHKIPKILGNTNKYQKVPKIA